MGSLVNSYKQLPLRVYQTGMSLPHHLRQVPMPQLTPHVISQDASFAMSADPALAYFAGENSL